MLTLLFVKILVPLRESHEAVESHILGIKSVLGVLSTLELVWPSCLVSEVKTDTNRVLLQEKVPEIHFRVSPLSLVDGTSA